MSEKIVQYSNPTHDTCTKFCLNRTSEMMLKGNGRTADLENIPSSQPDSLRLRKQKHTETTCITKISFCQSSTHPKLWRNYVGRNVTVIIKG